ncbi:MAG: hypothetical protein IKW76_08040 [Clostridia bacterium]|nr:hypothetical protein [Clostridia bacterium]
MKYADTPRLPSQSSCFKLYRSTTNRGQNAGHEPPNLKKDKKIFKKVHIGAKLELKGVDNSLFAVYNNKLYLCIMDKIASVCFTVFGAETVGRAKPKKGTE